MDKVEREGEVVGNGEREWGAGGAGGCEDANEGAAEMVGR